MIKAKIINYKLFFTFSYRKLTLKMLFQANYTKTCSSPLSYHFRMIANPGKLNESRQPIPVVTVDYCNCEIRHL